NAVYGRALGGREHRCRYPYVALGSRHRLRFVIRLDRGRMRRHVGTGNNDAGDKSDSGCAHPLGAPFMLASALSAFDLTVTRRWTFQKTHAERLVTRPPVTGSPKIWLRIGTPTALARASAGGVPVTYRRLSRSARRAWPRHVDYAIDGPAYGRALTTAPNPCSGFVLSARADSRPNV